MPTQRNAYHKGLRLAVQALCVVAAAASSTRSYVSQSTSNAPPTSAGPASRSDPSPGSYYANIDTSLNGAAFQQELTTLISVSTSISYAQLWTAFQVLCALQPVPAPSCLVMSPSLPCPVTLSHCISRLRYMKYIIIAMH